MHLRSKNDTIWIFSYAYVSLNRQIPTFKTFKGYKSMLFKIYIVLNVSLQNIISIVDILIYQYLIPPYISIYTPYAPSSYIQEVPYKGTPHPPKIKTN